MLPKHIVRLSLEERKHLFEVIADGRTGKEKLNRARILLKADIGEQGEGWTDAEIAEAFYVGLKTVARTRVSLVEEGFDATLNRRIPSERRSRIIEGKEEAYLIAIACGAPPEGHCRWTLRMLANRMVELNYLENVSHETIRTALKKMNLSPGKRRSGVYHVNQMTPSSAKWKKSSMCI